MDSVFRSLAVSLTPAPTSHPQRVAVDGITAAGKTTFADHLAAAIVETGRHAIRLSMDGYHHPRAIRYRQGRGSADGYYEDAYDFETFRRLVLEPLGAECSWRYRPSVIDLATDQPTHEADVDVPANAILVVDGSFLQKPVLRDRWDRVVYLRTSFQAAEARGARRDADLLGGIDAARTAFRDRYHAAQHRYLAECDPEASADVVIDVEDPAHPSFVRPTEDP